MNGSGDRTSTRFSRSCACELIQLLPSDILRSHGPRIGERLLVTLCEWSVS